jgi:hypothetical protein
MQEASMQKEREKFYLEEACRASAIFPHGDIVSSEKPDFLLHTENKTIGIEITELCREEPRADAAMLTGAVGDAKIIYHQPISARPVEVVASFSMIAERVKRKILAKTLAEFVKAHVAGEQPDVPEGYSRIGVHAPLEQIDPTGRWMGLKATNTIVAPEQLLKDSIQKKNKSVVTYRLKTSEVWLLIINDQFLGAGEVYVRPEDLTKWKFQFDFEKVLLFSREAGGGGAVFELQRQI